MPPPGPSALGPEPRGHCTPRDSCVLELLAPAVPPPASPRVRAPGTPPSPPPPGSPPVPRAAAAPRHVPGYAAARPTSVPPAPSDFAPDAGGLFVRASADAPAMRLEPPHARHGIPAPGGYGRVTHFETDLFVGKMQPVFRLPPEIESPGAARPRLLPARMASSSSGGAVMGRAALFRAPARARMHTAPLRHSPTSSPPPFSVQPWGSC
jgi:hypothetical protein